MDYSEIIAVVLLSVKVSLTATFLGAVIGISAAIPVVLKDFAFKKLLLRITDTLMSLPPVLIGLVVYLVLSRQGPLGNLELLFTPSAMVMAQTILVTPIIFGVTVNTLAKSAREIEKTCLALGANRSDIFKAIIYESRLQLLTVVTLGLGRAISEVGAVMMVGGNIKGHTRVMTTYIALETGKGNFNEAIAIGVVLLGVAFILNILLHSFQRREAP